jgi:hypothetical protein
MSKKPTIPRSEAAEAYAAFALEFEPYEYETKLFVFTDKRSGARYCECHIKGSKLISLGRTDVPLDPDQPEYRANRELVTNHAAFAKMQEDARAGRVFSNIVAEYTKEFDPEHPLKIIGGQHRFEAIKGAVEAGVDEYHGVKVYLDLDMDQRLDVQLTSNTNIAISSDLYDRMQETFKGPELREWSQSVGLLEAGQDFADRGGRGRPITVRDARTFICNYFRGQKVDSKKFDVSDTTPLLCDSGQHDTEWEQLRVSEPDLWKHPGLLQAGKKFAPLVKSQRDAFASKSPKPPVDYPEKALNGAVLAAC